MKENKVKSFSRATKSKNGIVRMALVIFAFLVQTAFIVGLFTWFSGFSQWVSFAVEVIAVLTALVVYSSDRTSSIKAPWIVMMLILPVFGLALYFVIGFDSTVRKMRKKYEEVDAKLLPMLPDSSNLIEEIKVKNKAMGSISRYIAQNSGYPVYNNCDVQYFDDASKGLEAQIAAISAAEKFIFLEYHAIEMAESWERIFAALTERVKAGVEVRVLYDDMGSIGFVDQDFALALEYEGIKCKIFNPFHLGRNIFLNNRDHRKITVIDGYIGFTGGYNIAEEYFNNTHPYGQWKDSGVCIAGDAVKNLTAMFLEMWNAMDNNAEDFAGYLTAPAYSSFENACVQPYGEIPTDGKHVGEDVYISMLGLATNYCWFMTPYLIITDEMIHAINLAARRGVDVRIITPGIPDKKIVYQVTRSYYRSLMKNGVKIYEWTPGFCHAKMCITDDKMAVCGTINLDYRSLYHHFEDAALISGSRAVFDIKADFEKTFGESREVTEEFYKGTVNALKYLGQLVLRLIAELL